VGCKQAVQAKKNESKAYPSDLRTSNSPALSLSHIQEGRSHQQ